MVTDPGLCPIPPGFRVIGGFNDAFDNFRDTAPYDHWTDEHGVDHGENDGVSKRWKNPELRSANLLCGFQFKIGPGLGTRWKDPIFGGSETIGTVNGGDVNVHFPRRDGPGGTRGGYIASLKWYKEGFTTVLTEQDLEKEIPHGDYAGDFGWGGKFNLHHADLIGQTKIGQTKINDGNWHSFLAVAYNELLPRDLDNPQNPQNFEEFPIIRLWYSHTPTTKFEDFTLLGWGVDNGLATGRIPPRGPLKDEIGEGGILEEWWGG